MKFSKSYLMQLVYLSLHLQYAGLFVEMDIQGRKFSKLRQRYDYRGDFMAEVAFYRQEQFVWIDESGCDKRDNIRKFGYSIRGTHQNTMQV